MQGFQFLQNHQNDKDNILVIFIIRGKPRISNSTTLCYNYIEMEESLIVYAVLDSGNKIVKDSITGEFSLRDNNLIFIKLVPNAEEMIRCYCRAYHIEE